MADEHEQFISEEEELKRIRKKKLKELTELKVKKQKMSMEPINVTDSNFDETVREHSLALID